MIKNIHKIVKNNKKIHKFCIKFLKYYKKRIKILRKLYLRPMVLLKLLMINDNLCHLTSPLCKVCVCRKLIESLCKTCG